MNARLITTGVVLSAAIGTCCLAKSAIDRVFLQDALGEAACEIRERHDFVGVPIPAATVQEVFSDLTTASIAPVWVDAAGTPVDPWGTSFRAFADARGLVVCESAGPDRKFGTSDDVSSRR